MHYLDWGNPEAPPLLLIHGNRDHCHNWDWVAQALRKDWHVIAPDFRGHGDSQWVIGSAYGHTEYVYDIAQLIYQQNLAPVTIIAHSLGGGVALRYAGVYPENVSRMVVIEGASGWPHRNVDEPVHERMRNWIDSTRKVSGRLPKRYATLEEAFRRMHAANSHLREDQARHLTIHGGNQNEDGTYSWKFDNYTHVMSAFDITFEETQDLWRRIDCPVLLVSGSESWARHGEQDQRRRRHEAHPHQQCGTSGPGNAETVAGAVVESDADRCRLRHAIGDDPRRRRRYPYAPRRPD